MSNGKSSLLRKLIPKSYHFDGYNELNCPNSRDKPFFSEKTVELGNYSLTTRFNSTGNLVLEYSSVCPNGRISFEPYELSFNTFVTLLREAIDEDRDFIAFDIQVKYLTRYMHTTEYCQKNCHDINRDCESILKLRPKSFMAAVSFEKTDIKNALSVFFGIKKDNSQGGITTMAGKMKKLLGMNFEIGISKDRNIASTLMGIAVRNPEDGNWYIYDHAQCKRTNIAGLKMGNFPVVLIPTNAVNIGDLIKLEGKYYFVDAVDNKKLTLIGAADGVITQRVMSDSLIPGMNFYIKVVAFDAKTLTDPNSNQNVSSGLLAAMCLMSWKEGKSEFSLDNVSNDSFNGLGEFLPLILMSGNNCGLGNMFGDGNGGINLPLLMALGGDGEDNEMMQMIALSQLLSSGNNNVANPILGALSGAVTATAPTNSEVFCPSCGKTYSTDVKFCPACGTPTEVKGKKCSNCGTTLKDGAAFCHVCGKKVTADVCPNCGNKVSGDDNFCPHCGHNLKQDSPAVAPVQVEPTITTPTTPTVKSE